MITVILLTISIVTVILLIAIIAIVITTVVITIAFEQNSSKAQATVRYSLHAEHFASRSPSSASLM